MKHIKRIPPRHRVAVIAESAHGSGTSQAGVHLTKPHLYSVNICYGVQADGLLCCGIFLNVFCLCVCVSGICLFSAVMEKEQAPMLRHFCCSGIDNEVGDWGIWALTIFLSIFCFFLRDLGQDNISLFVCLKD